ncbi:hypothetical protein Dvina_49090 [Dactylosporangium vinaceum]|uniref:Uncharacterized protein n=1 Tax=Dactylosporangium vinaceum TaxID=53362 RepID=A0ABV5LYB5_9ACTN|nr:hypothetical protein [Dactylosporangium vinaceum]UAB95849.1 hypothetical protein Dvina_49090 [Dactylosporangium vinaceum]
MPTNDQLGAAVRKLVGQVSHWTPPRWAASGLSGASRADLMHDLIQWLADRTAEAEARPPLPVPRLDNDLALPDQLQVIAADLARYAPPEVQQEAAARIAALRGAFS